MESKAAVTGLAALAQDTRLAIFRLLVIHGHLGLTVGKIGEELQVPATTLSFHLRELAHANLIVAHHEGRFTTYVANFETMNNLLDFLTESCCTAPGCGPEETASVRKVRSTPRKHPQSATTII